VNAFEYLRPTLLAEATAALAEHGPEARVLAGGTDLTVALRDGKLKPRAVIDIKRIADLPPDIAQHDGHLVISARARMADLANDPTVQTLFPALVEAAAVVGSFQIRNRATLAGNACNASPAADTVPVLVAHGAELVIAGCGTERVMPLVDFIEGNRRTALTRGEMVTAIRLPIPSGPAGAAFERMTRRRGVDLATVNVCCAIDDAGMARFAFGAVAPKPFLVRDAGELAHPETSAARKDAIMESLFSAASPITDVRASADYRRAMIRVLAERALVRATGRRSAGGRHV
jgi:CO/xanthine dehydrogenase FAD-binding subunit